MDRRWFPAKHCLRDEPRDLWQCADLPAGPAPQARGRRHAVPEPDDPRMRRSRRRWCGWASTCRIRSRASPSATITAPGSWSMPQRGLVVVDRNTVPVAMGDVRITFAGTLEMPGKVEFVHPLHNLAIVGYDPKLIGNTPVEGAQVLSRTTSSRAKTVWVVGMGADSEIRSRATQMADIEPMQLPLSRTMQFRDSNVEGIAAGESAARLRRRAARKSGAAWSALWSSFAWESGRELQQENRGVPSARRRHAPPRAGRAAACTRSKWSSRRSRWRVRATSASRMSGCASWRPVPSSAQVLSAVRMVGGSPAVGRLKQGDYPRHRRTSRHAIPRSGTRCRGQGSRSRSRCGGRRREKLEVPTAAAAGHGHRSDREWAGATLQAPHRAMIAQRGIPPEGVYVGYFSYGSPATRYGLYPGRRIVEVDGMPTPDLDAFLAAVTGRPDRASVRLRTITWNNAPEVITLKLDKHYWPAYELRRTESGWERHDLE